MEEDLKAKQISNQLTEVLECRSPFVTKPRKQKKPTYIMKKEDKLNQNYESPFKKVNSNQPQNLTLKKNLQGSKAIESPFQMKTFNND